MKEIWIDFLVGEFADLKDLPLKIAIDCANGAGAEVARIVGDRLGLNLTLVNTCGQINKGTEDLPEDFDIAFAFDGDADRCAVILPDGKVHGDKLLAALAVWLNEKGKLQDRLTGSSVTLVGTVLFNSGTEKWLNERGISVLRVPVGDKYVCEALDKHGLKLGGEESGHIIVPDLYHAGDGLMAALLVLRMLIAQPDALSTVTVSPAHTKNFVASAGMKAFLRTDEFAEFLAELNELNPDTRIVIRPSGTEDFVRVLVEG